MTVTDILEMSEAEIMLAPARGDTRLHCCTGCADCSDCECCVNCSRCNDCQSCTNCIACNHCINCNSCTSCSSCRNCYNCFNFHGRDFCIGDRQFSQIAYYKALSLLGD
jgi:hypothetical protein